MCKQNNIIPLNTFCRSLLMVAIILFAGSSLLAQSPLSSFLQGEQLFKDKKYFEAAQCYERYLAKEKKSKPRSIPFAPEKKIKGKSNFNPYQEAVYHLAESYRLYNDYVKAEKWYAAATKFPETTYPECRYWYAVTLRANQKFTQAIGALDTFLQTYTTMGPVLNSADREYENLKFITAQLANPDSNHFIVSTAQQQKGSTSSYALATKNEDTVVFTSIHGDSARQKDGKYAYSYTNELFESVEGTDIMQNAKMISLPKPDLHNGLASFTKDGKKMFFTQWTKKDGGNSSAIYMRELNATGGWTSAVKLNSQINTKGYNSAQPFITTDGKYLLFASDKPGGFGNYDIWAATMDSNLQVLSVKNLGGVINTAADEESPFYHTNSRTLVFASNGHIGMGGFDIYTSQGNQNFSYWEKPVNPGKPINSVKDDLYYTGTDEDNLWNTGWLSSDRSSDCCLALFTVAQNNQQYVQGTVIDCNSGKAIQGVKLTVMSTRNKKKILSVNQTDTAGHYAFELRNAPGIHIIAEKEGYITKDSSYTIQIRRMKDTITNNPVCLVLIADTVKKAVQNILESLSQSATIGNFLYQKTNLNTSSYHNLDSLAAVMIKYPAIKVQIGGYTDGNGTEEYNLKLAQARVDVCIAYLVKKGISRERLEGKAFGECCPLETETINGKDNPAARARNRRVEYKVIEE